ncbi:hypothetical protein P1P75_01150 [Streptomyces sp. ID05-39B]|uniref:hypothetical protein n=1 Tax=Streptomyces sp. ID05-39B TaxID=3028664 RepID=UPI0029BC38D9|nr:hypothetical protein [Streptomyces sp. ID05-39B]MDX3525093.1 hypothetical protein [Streptomyces sp. ID05-39B]
MVSLDKTAQSIGYGRMRAAINRGVRRNNLLALSVEFGERAYDVEVKAFEAHKAAVLGLSNAKDPWKRCQNACHAPIRDVEDFCSEGCWEEWHKVNDPEAYERWLHSGVGR